MKKFTSVILIIVILQQIAISSVMAQTNIENSLNEIQNIDNIYLGNATVDKQQTSISNTIKSFNQSAKNSIIKFQSQMTQEIKAQEDVNDYYNSLNDTNSFFSIINGIFNSMQNILPTPKSTSSNTISSGSDLNTPSVKSSSSLDATSTSLKNSTGTIIDELDTLDNSTSYAAESKLDSENKISGDNSIKLDSTQADFMVLEQNVDLDLTNSKNIEFNTFIYNPSDIYSIGVILFSGNSGSSDYYIDYIGQYELTNGWNTIRRELTKFTPNGAAKFNNIKAIRFVVNFKSPTLSINFDKIQYDVTGSTEIMFNFEVGYYETYTKSYPILKSKGYRATVFPVKQIIDYQAIDFLDTTDLTNLYRAGWDIGNYSETFPIDWSNMTYEQKMQEYTNAKEWLNLNGWLRGADFVSYPLGYIDNDITKIMANLDVKCAFSSTYGIQETPANNLYNLKTISINDTTTVDSLKIAVDKALNTGSSIAFKIGKIEPLKLSQLVDYISSKNVTVSTISQWYSHYQGLAYQVPEAQSEIALPVAQNYKQIVPFKETTTSLKTSNGNLLNMFDSLNNWSNVRRGTLSLDTTNKMDGTSSLKIASQVLNGGGSTIIEYNSPSPLDLSKMASLQMGFYTDNPTEIYSISVAFYDNNTFGSNYCINYTGGYELMKGWNKIIRIKSDFYTVGANTFNNIHKIRIVVNGSAGSNPVVGIDNFRYNLTGKTKILFTFDDAWSDVLTNGYPILSAKGYKGTLWACKGLSTVGDPDFLSLSQLKQMYRNGWDVGNHSNTHDDDIAARSITKKYTEYSTNQNWLLMNGFFRSYNHVCYPMGSHNDELIKVLKSIGVKTARTTIYGIQPVGVEDIYRLKTIPIGKDIPFSLIKNEVDKAVQSGSTVMFMLHRIEDIPTEVYDISTNDFKGIVEYISQLDSQDKLDVQTISQWYNSYLTR